MVAEFNIYRYKIAVTYLFGNHETIIDLISDREYQRFYDRFETASLYIINNIHKLAVFENNIHSLKNSKFKIIKKKLFKLRNYYILFDIVYSEPFIDY